MFYFSWKLAVAVSFRNPFPKQLRVASILTKNIKIEPLMDCLDCGACCRAREGTILIEDEDIEKWKFSGHQNIIESLVPGHFGQLAFPMGANNRCIYQGTSTSPYACSIYENRASICRSFKKLCPQCLDIMRNRFMPL